MTTPGCTCVIPGSGYDFGRVDSACPHHGSQVKNEPLLGTCPGTSRCECATNPYFLPSGSAVLCPSQVADLLAELARLRNAVCVCGRKQGEETS